MTRMRATVEIRDEVGRKLEELARQRGDEEISSLVGEALDLYMAEQPSRKGSLAEILNLDGTFSDEDAEHFRQVLRDLRSA